VEKLNITHEFKYDYSKVELVGDIKNVPITVICPVHGDFSILVQKHYKHGCPECEKDNPKKKRGSIKQSKPGNHWLDTMERILGITLVREFRLPENQLCNLHQKELSYLVNEQLWLMALSP
jgi:hypothetical protein